LDVPIAEWRSLVHTLVPLCATSHPLLRLVLTQVSQEESQSLGRRRREWLAMRCSFRARMGDINAAMLLGE